MVPRAGRGAAVGVVTTCSGTTSARCWCKLSDGVSRRDTQLWAHRMTYDFWARSAVRKLVGQGVWVSAPAGNADRGLDEDDLMWPAVLSGREDAT